MEEIIAPTNTKNYEYFLRQWFIREYPNFTTIESRVKIQIIKKSFHHHIPSISYIKDTFQSNKKKEKK